MGEGHLSDLIPLWLAFVAMVAIVLLSIYAGLVLAHFRTSLVGVDEETSVSTVVAAMVALLGFLLAFTFGVTAGRLDTRKGLLLDEVNAIETTFLRTRLIPESHGAAVRTLLREYIDIRVELPRQPGKVGQMIKRSEQLQGLMWSHAAALTEADLKNPDIAALFVDSLNEMLDLQTKRATVSMIQRLPSVMWVPAVLRDGQQHACEIGPPIGTGSPGPEASVHELGSSTERRVPERMLLPSRQGPSQWH